MRTKINNNKLKILILLKIIIYALNVSFFKVWFHCIGKSTLTMQVLEKTAECANIG